MNNNVSRDNRWGDYLKLDNEQHGPLTDQMKNVDSIISLPIVEPIKLERLSQIEDLAWRVKRAVKGMFQYYRPTIIERLCILHFLYVFKRTKLKRDRSIKEVNACARKLVEKIFIKHYAREQEEILKLIKCQSSSEK